MDTSIHNRILCYMGVIEDPVDLRQAELVGLSTVSMLSKAMRSVASHIESQVQQLTASKLPLLHTPRLSQRFPSLRSLDLLNCSPLTSSSIKQISALTQLQSLSINIDHLLPDPESLKLGQEKTYAEPTKCDLMFADEAYWYWHDPDSKSEPVRGRLLSTTHQLELGSTADADEQQQVQHVIEYGGDWSSGAS